MQPFARVSSNSIINEADLQIVFYVLLQSVKQHS